MSRGVSVRRVKGRKWVINLGIIPFGWWRRRSGESAKAGLLWVLNDEITFMTLGAQRESGKKKRKERMICYTFFFLTPKTTFFLFLLLFLERQWNNKWTYFLLFCLCLTPVDLVVRLQGRDRSRFRLVQQIFSKLCGSISDYYRIGIPMLNPSYPSSVMLFVHTKRG